MQTIFLTAVSIWVKCNIFSQYQSFLFLLCLRTDVALHLFSPRGKRRSRTSRHIWALREESKQMSTGRLLRKALRDAGRGLFLTASYPRIPSKLEPELVSGAIRREKRWNSFKRLGSLWITMGGRTGRTRRMTMINLGMKIKKQARTWLWRAFRVRNWSVYPPPPHQSEDKRLSVQQFSSSICSFLFKPPYSLLVILHFINYSFSELHLA